MAILVVRETVCADSFTAVVRKEDVRGWEVDRVVLEEGFRVGDIIRGVVVSGLASLPQYICNLCIRFLEGVFMLT